MTARRAYVEVYQRDDALWDWRLCASNGKIVATSGSQGYNTENRAEEMAYRVVSGEFSDAIYYTIDSDTDSVRFFKRHVHTREDIYLSTIIIHRCTTCGDERFTTIGRKDS